MAFSSNPSATSNYPSVLSNHIEGQCICFGGYHSGWYQYDRLGQYFSHFVSGYRIHLQNSSLDKHPIDGPKFYTVLSIDTFSQFAQYRFLNALYNGH